MVRWFRPVLLAMVVSSVSLLQRQPQVLPGPMYPPGQVKKALR